MQIELTETLTLSLVSKLFPSYDIVRVWTNKVGIEAPDGSFLGSTGWYYRATKRCTDLRPVEAGSMYELIGKITVGAESFYPSEQDAN